MEKSKGKEEATAGAAAEDVNATASPDAAEGRKERLDKLAKHHVLAAMGVGLVPLPVVDMVALVGIQLDLIRKLSAEYAVPFRQDMGKSVIASLMGGFLPVTLGCTVASLIKFIPLVGQTTGAVTMPVVSGASTYAIYKVFVQHFESGGTFLDLEPSKVKSYFAEQFSKGKKFAMTLKTKEPVKTEA
jgi:uncharacterized protein (DUF697 family)